MTPLAAKVANELALPIAKRKISDDGRVLSLIGRDMHCFDVTAISKPVHDALEAENLWPDVEAMLPRMFLPSPVTWLEYRAVDHRLAWTLEDCGESTFRLSMVLDKADLYSLPLCDFRARSILEPGERIAIESRVNEGISRAHGRGRKDGRLAALRESVGELSEKGLPLDQRGRLLAARVELAKMEMAHETSELARVQSQIANLETALAPSDGEMDGLIKLGIAFSVLTLDLINTPGLIGLRQHDPHRGLARKLLSARVGSYPLRGWSEVVLKHQTRIADATEHHTGATFHKCLHFVRSHLRHYRDGKVTTIPAHWRGDPALGIKRTRYRLAA